MENELTSLSVVIPVYNEPNWIPRTVDRVAAHLESSQWETPEIIVVDDGSTDETGRIVDDLRAAVPIRVIHTDNHGRFKARLSGIDDAHNEYVLLLDARVLVERGLAELYDEVRSGNVVWNAHVNVNTAGNLLAIFWDAMPRIFWSAYFDRPRRLSYGIDDFVKFPKGTTCFLAPRKDLLDAYAAFSTKYEDARDANDDTPLIEHLAHRHEIWISPGFACLYEPRQKLGRFLPHTLHRGVVFVDAYLKPGNPYAIAIVGWCLGSLCVLLASIRKPWVIPASVFSTTLAAGAVGVLKRLPRPHVIALAVISPLFVLAYGAGIWLGIYKACRWRILRRRYQTSSAKAMTDA